MKSLGMKLFAVVATFASLSSTPTQAAPPAAKNAARIEIEGLDPADYTKTRARRPDLSKALATKSIEQRLAVAVADDVEAVVEFADDSAYAGLDHKAKAAVRRMERQAVKIGALVSLVDVYGADSARIDDAFVKVLDDVDPVVAAQAAERFGARKSERVVPTLTALANDDDRALDVRSGAFAGLARQRSEASFEALVQVATSTTTPELQVAAAQSLELLCSRWAFAARHEEALGTTLRGKAVAALSSVKWQGAAEVKRQQVLKRLSA